MRTKPKASVTDKAYAADDSTYSLLTKAAIEAVIKRQWDIYIKLPYFCKVAEGFPKGLKSRFDATYDIYKAKSRRVLDWLYDNGHSTMNSDDVMKLTREFAYLEGRVERELAKEKELLYNDDLTKENKYE